MEKIGTILLNSLRKTRLEKKLNELRIFVNYETMVGEKIAEISKPTFMQNGTLFVGVNNHIWMHELYMLKPELVDKINSKLPRPLVKNIKFQICDIKRIKNPKPDLQVKKDTHFEIPEKTMNFIYNICQDIDDEDLRDTFKKFMIKDAKYKMKRGNSFVHTHRR
ncbi:MAG: DUF721 domain-containing protein [Thermoanaerobacteraceae bacterium]|nr:DUF721 domain-containing protein [Thermoanaerobacteraceae bacterium]